MFINPASKGFRVFPLVFGRKPFVVEIMLFQDEGIDVASRNKVNFIGGLVAATDDVVNNRVNVTVSSPDLHSPVTVVDGSTIDFTLTGQQITAEVIAGNINHNALLNFNAFEHIDWTNAADVLSTTEAGTFNTGGTHVANLGEEGGYAGYFTNGTAVMYLCKTANAIEINSDTIFKNDGTGFPKTATFALALGIPATVGVNKTNEIIIPRTGEIVKAFAYVKTAPTGANLIFDINLNGTTIWSTQGNRLTVSAGQNSASTTTFNTTAVTEGDRLTIDIDQVGSTVAGQDITVQLLMRLINQ